MLKSYSWGILNDTEWLVPHRTLVILLPSQYLKRPFSSEGQVFSEDVQIVSIHYTILEAKMRIIRIGAPRSL